MQIDGYSGAIHKSFNSKTTAMAFLGDDYKDDLLEKFVDESILNIYVDGSYCSLNNINGLGCVMVENNKEIHTISKQTKSNDQSNVGAEIESALTAVNWAIENGYEALFINYDYLGIEMWATGAWNANNSITASYARKMRGHQQQIKIGFNKIKAHSGNFF